ncbi:MAG: CBS domain-containing protein [Deltaproteobacteria bacterium]
MKERITIPAQATIREALQVIDANHHGIVLVLDATQRVIGTATDGDIRRQLLEGLTLEDRIEQCAEPNFVWAPVGESRERLLKLLDHRVKLIPLLDSERRLVEVIARDHFPLPEESPVYVRARAPVRISFGGGGSDLTHYFTEHGGAVINTTISLYSHATLRMREDAQVRIYSHDLRQQLEAQSLDQLLAHPPHSLDLLLAILRLVRPEFGFELTVASDFAAGSGLGGSAVVTAAILGCFNQLRQDQWDAHELAEMAFQAERLYLEVAGGWQDQYATVFGGFNFIEFRPDQNLVHPLRIHPDVLIELEESLLLCDTGIQHNSGEIHQDQRQQLERAEIQQLVQENVKLTYQMRDHLLRGRLHEFGYALHQAWELKRQFSSKISNSQLDATYELARRHGALGGKILGAGSGGFFLFYTEPFRKYELAQALEEAGLKIRSFRFDLEGLRAWKVREPHPNLTSN